MSLMRRLWQRPLSRFTVVALLLLLLSAGTMSMKTVSFAQHARPTAASSCQLNSASGAIQHVIFIQFDNTHFTRDNPNVPSDLEQMPDLLNFIENNGVLISNEHTPLIAHTADDVILPSPVSMATSTECRLPTPTAISILTAQAVWQTLSHTGQTR